MSKKQSAATPATSASGPGTPGWFPRVGEVWPGQGIYAGIVRGEPGQPDYHLFLSGDSRSAHDGIAWGPHGVRVDGAGSERDGLANTAALCAQSQAHPAAAWAAGLDLDGHKDWYLPARRELRLCWVNCPELFKPGWYWSSTQFSSDFAWVQYFAGGSQVTYDKDYEGRARAVRRLLIQ